MFVKLDKFILIVEIVYIMILYFNGIEYDIIEGIKLDKYCLIFVLNMMEFYILQIRNNVLEEISGIYWLVLGIFDISNYILFYSNISEIFEVY